MACCSTNKAVHDHKRDESLWSCFKHELMHHLPYATMSVALALMIVSLINVFFDSGIVACTLPAAHNHVHGAMCNHSHSSGMDVLFHSFHFMHILFATTGTMITFYRYSKRFFMGILIGSVSSMIFCTLSDILLPYVAGSMLGVQMELHICFATELANIVPFLLVGLINGIVMSYSDEYMTEQNSLTLHFWHTFISAMASIFYAIGHGLPNYYDHLGMFFMLMVVAVIIPCTLSDVVAPILFARATDTK